jgi:DNA (cytosine-5)-methyltransferase 1
MRVLDLFSGMGGLALGFKRAGFRVTGVDILPAAVKTYRHNVGDCLQMDLSRKVVAGRYDIIIGGPPCRPWSSINLKKRGKIHPDYGLLSRFFLHIRKIKPDAFLLENVVPLRKDNLFLKELNSLRNDLGYSVEFSTVVYSKFGAATRRRRLITVGIRHGSAELFFQKLEQYSGTPKTVRQALSPLTDPQQDPDHVWPQPKTIDKYIDKYRTGKYGWYILRWDEPAPSFGNVMKTYILHPDSFNGGVTRVISVKEALLIMGFDRDFSFPKGIPMSTRYQMVADTVSPCFSEAAARILMSLLE